MKSRKKLICLAVAASLVMGAAFTGCTAINNEADVKQTVAVVNISKADAFKDEFNGYESVITDKVFLKRDMLTAFYNSYSYYTQMNYSYAEIFELIKDNLVSNAVTTQYATVYMLKAKGDDALTEYLALPTEAEKCEYILGGKESEPVKRAVYNLKSTLNSVLDSAERNIIEDEEEDDEYSGSGTRSTPSGVNATVEEYIPEYYNVYTGYKGYLLTDENMAKAVENEDYEPVYGTTQVTRQKAYASFLNSLKSNYLLSEEDTQTTDIWELSYVVESYVSQLQSEIVSEFQDKIKEEKEAIISSVDENDIYSYVKAQYESELEKQSAENDKSSSFESNMGSLSDSKFILYCPDTTGDTEQQGGTYGTFGYVYNILLPFSSVQENMLSVAQSDKNGEIITESEYFVERNAILKNIVTTDQRSAWFNGTTDYSFDASESELEYYGKADGRKYLFFENNLTDTTQYKQIEKYDGRYSYNGTVKKNTNGSYTLIPKKLSIDDMLAEFSAYINYVLGGEDLVEIHPGDTMDGVWEDTNDAFYQTKNYTKGEDGKEIDYSLLVYATGKVTLDQKSREDMLVTDKENQTDRYKAMSAVNELQYAYTTDTGVLSQYIGYTVSAYDTSYIKEFEYAAQQAIRDGVGTFKVCAGDYGWHLIYVTETFDTAGGEVYNPSFTESRVNLEGSFENRFYNWIKDSHLAKEVTFKNNTVLKEYNTDKAVTVYKDAYKNLSGL